MWLRTPMAQGQTHSSPRPPHHLTPHLWEASTWRCPSWRRRGSRSALRAEDPGGCCPALVFLMAKGGHRGWGCMGRGLWEPCIQLRHLAGSGRPLLWGGDVQGSFISLLGHLGQGPRGAAGNRGASLPAQLRSLTCRSPTGRGLTLLPQAQAQAPLQRGPRRSPGMGLGAQGRLCGKASGSCVPCQVSAILGRHREGRRVGERAPSCGAARRARAPSPRAGTGHAS